MSAAAASQVAIKRGPGRPRKHPLPPQAATCVEISSHEENKLLDIKEDIHLVLDLIKTNHIQSRSIRDILSTKRTCDERRALFESMEEEALNDLEFLNNMQLRTQNYKHPQRYDNPVPQWEGWAPPEDDDDDDDLRDDNKTDQKSRNRYGVAPRNAKTAEVTAANLPVPKNTHQLYQKAIDAYNRLQTKVKKQEKTIQSLKESQKRQKQYAQLYMTWKNKYDALYRAVGKGHVKSDPIDVDD